ncbi:MAG: hypothetical protein ONB48_04600 [candidate division KSB1 bacterium]|nr:hypothetical protein [candidate division KSB1 bacterium]MDZ7274409.1 hypothetical protein [candidate division KSB1 bacterium]MDZ7284929.1 hypothetical protein [candidate division KSB1 bacterium]MDZ7297650.1 hypothetical protein [candidate division KSB1 bacterium]MDZ7348517.1 hypothetical protein [candidate division KSB1 bacterium]
MLPRRRRVCPAARLALIKKYLASGLTQKQFCRREKLAYPTFLTWLRKHRAASCTLEFPSGVLVHFSGDIAVQLLTRLLRATGVEP